MHTLANSEDRQQLVDRLGAVCAADVALWGLMSAPEMICHVRAAFRTAMGEIPCEPVKVPMPRAALKALALWVPTPWKQGFETVPALKCGEPAMLPGDFATDQNGALQELERFCQPNQVLVNHAFFGPMSLADWMRWGFLHTDHHLRQFGR